MCIRDRYNIKETIQFYYIQQSWNTYSIVVKMSSVPETEEENEIVEGEEKYIIILRYWDAWRFL